MILAGGGLALVLLVPALTAAMPSSTEWRDAALVTYPATAWSGDARHVADGLVLSLTVPNTLCSSASAADGSGIAGVVLADTWRGTYPITTGLSQGYAPRLQDGADGLLLEAQPHGKAPIAVSGRVLDVSVAADAVLAESWTTACGEADSYVLAAPDGLIGGRVGEEG
ncbi:hypothetical protein SAMN05421637_2431 [Demequina mangrovi]|uniref:Uncharacterized protein n=2 Tax=Demequina mangrovi TaxID=1043493 RepID=A0A1H7A8U8_9MICO|nr:hypothetical protein SAMN05421637_2431 [Demequina mangrovi]